VGSLAFSSKTHLAMVLDYFNLIDVRIQKIIGSEARQNITTNELIERVFHLNEYTCGTQIILSLRVSRG